MRQDRRNCGKAAEWQGFLEREKHSRAKWTRCLFESAAAAVATAAAAATAAPAAEVVHTKSISLLLTRPAHWQP